MEAGSYSEAVSAPMSCVTYSHINGRTGGHFLYLAQGHVNSNSTHEGKHDILINLIKDKFSINSATNLLCYAAENILDFLQSEKNVFKFFLCCCFFLPVHENVGLTALKPTGIRVQNIFIE